MTKILVDKETGEEFAVAQYTTGLGNAPVSFLNPIPKPAKSLEEEVEDYIKKNRLELEASAGRSQYMSVPMLALIRVLDRRAREGKKGE